MIKLWGIFFICLFLVTSCAVGPNFRKPIVPAPKTYTAKSLGTKTIATSTQFGKAQHFNVKQEIPKQWWTLFHSKPLNELIISSFKHNPTVASAKAALHASLETLYAQRGSLYPFLGAQFLPSTQKMSRILASLLTDNAYNFSLYTGQLFISYTPDVFGGIRRQIESQAAQANYQLYQLEATYLTISTNVVNAAIQEASVREQIVATKKIIATQSRILAMYKQSNKIGDASIADIATQEAGLAALEATLPPLETQLALQRNLLNSLTGRFPDDPLTPKFTLNSLHLPSELPISLPSTLVEHRPDIRAAEELMHSANALIGVAVANRLPNVTISSTNAGSTAVSIPSLFSPNTNFWALAGIITQPVFDAGTRLHQQRFAQATYTQAAADYRATVINAFQNVADTLRAIQFDAKALLAASRAERAALKSLTISQAQLSLGDSSALSIHINSILYQQAKLNLIQAKANRLADTAALFQALGGGWRNC